MLKAEDLLALSSPAAAQLDPSGQRVAFVLTEFSATDKNYSRNLWLYSAGDCRQLTRAGGVSQPRWSPDGRFLAYAGPAADGAGSKGRGQIWVMPMEGGEPYPVTTSTTTAHSPVWSPDGSYLLFLAADVPSEEDVRLEALGNTRKVDSPASMTQIWRVDLATLRATRLTRDRSTKATPAVAPDGRHIAFARQADPGCNHEYHSSVWVMDAQGRNKRRLSPSAGSARQPCFSPDSDAVAFLHRRLPQYGYVDLVAVSGIDGGGVTLLTDKLDRPAVQLAWGKADRVHLLLHDGLRQHLWVAPVRRGKPRQLTSGDRHLSELALSPDGKEALFVSSSPASPGQVHRCNADGSDEQPLTRLNTGWNKAALGRTRAVTWKAADGRSIDGLLSLPAGYRKGRKVPLIVEPHGGPAGGRTFAFAAAWHLLADRGYAVFAPNFRGSAGYGEEFVTANVDDLGGGDFSDVMTGVDHLIGRGIADPDRLGIMGLSYGGFMTGWAIGHTDRFKAAIAGAGVFNLQSFFGTSDIQWFTEHYQRGFPWERPEAYTRQSPITYADRMQTPTLIYHGDEDRRVPLEQSEQLYMALKHRRVPTEFIRYPREGHGISEYLHRLDYFRRMEAWFGRYLKRRP